MACIELAVHVMCSCLHCATGLVYQPSCLSLILLGSCSHSLISLVVACVVTALITFPLGLVVGIGVCWCSKRYSHERCGLKKKKPVLPKSIELTDNPAYGHIQGKPDDML